MPMKLNRRLFISRSGPLTAVPFAFWHSPMIGQNRLSSLRLGVVPNVSARVLLNQYEPLREYLSKTLQGATVSVETSSDWPSFYKAVKAQQFDLFALPAHVARLAQIELGSNPIAMFSGKIRGLMIACKDNKETEVVNLIRGKKVILANPASLVAIEGERWLETRHQLTPGRDFELSRVRNEDSIGLALTRGEASVGICSAAEFSVHPEPVRDRLRTVAVIGDLPSFFMMSGKNVPESTVKAVKTALTGFSSVSPEGEQFAQRTGGQRLLLDFPESELRAVDPFVERTRRLLS